MPIYSFNDLRRQAGEAWADRSDEDLILEYASQLKTDPVKLANELGFKPSSGGVSSQRFSSSLDRYQAGLYGFAEEATGAFGLDRVSNYLAEQRRANELAADVSSLRARNQGAVDEWKDVHSPSDFGSYVAGLGIQSVPYAAEALVGGFAGRLAMGGTRAAISAGQEALAAARGAGNVAAATTAVSDITKATSALRAGQTAGAVAASYPSAVGDILSNQREQAGETSPASAFALGVPYAAANAFGLEGAAARTQLFRNTINILDRPGGFTGGLARATATGVGTGLKEGASETFQEGMNQLGRMAVDPTEDFLSEAAQGRFKESFIGGAVLGGVTGSALGGWRRSTNDIQQALSQSGGTPVTNGVLPPPPPPAGTSTGAPPPPPAGTSTGAPPPPPPPAGAPAGAPPTNVGTTTQSVAPQLAQQRQEAFDLVGAKFSPDNGGMLTIFGAPIIGEGASNIFGNYLAANLQTAPAVVRLMSPALAQANEAVGGKLVSFDYNGTNPEASAKRLISQLQRTISGLQLSSATTPEQAAGILNTLSKTAKGQKLDQINAVFQALTGQNTDGYVASQKPKGATNGQQQVLQTPPGVGAVSEQSAAGAANGGTAGDVRPGGVQSLGAGSQPQGQAGQQAGQLPTEGIRAGSGVASDVSGGADQGSSEVTSLITGAPGGQPPQNISTQGAAGAAQGEAVRTEGTGETGGRPAAPAGTAKTAEVNQTPKQLWEDMDVSGVQYDQLPPAMREAWDLAVTRNSATGEIQEQIAAEAADASTESRTGKLLRSILDIVIRPTSRMPEEVAAKKREFFLAYYGGAPAETLADIAKSLGITPAQAKRWSSELDEFVQKHADKLTAAARAVMKEQGITDDEMQEALASMSSRSSISESMSEEDIEKEKAGNKNPDEALSSDDVGGNAKIEASGKRSFGEETPTTDEDENKKPEAEIGVVVTNKKTGSVQEQFNAVDTNNAKVLSLLEALNTIDEREESPRADMVKRAQEKVAEADGKLSVLAEGQAKDLALFAYANGDEQLGDSIVAMLNERLEVALGRGEKQAAQQTQKATEEKKATDEKKTTKPKTVRKAKTETKPVAQPLHTMEAAGEAWNAGVADYPTAPKWDQLSEEQQQTFFDFGVDNWSKEDVANELVKLAKSGVKFGVNPSAEVQNSYTAKELIAELSKFIRADILGRKLIIVDSVEALASHPDADIRALAATLSNKGAYGVAVNGTAYLIANRIPKGKGRGKFMHEVGAHLGLENLLPTKLYNELVSQLNEWANSDADTTEAKLARQAKARVEAAQTESEDADAELLAYFLEEALDAGIDPTATQLKESSALREWFRTLWAAFKVALRKLGFKPETLTAQDVVDLAFGAARLEMSGTFHGTAAIFRRFNHAFINSGEGAQAYGWGTYLAQRAGIGKGYWRDDVLRKLEAELTKRYLGKTITEEPLNPETQNPIGPIKLRKNKATYTVSLSPGKTITKDVIQAMALAIKRYGFDEISIDGKYQPVNIGSEGALMRVDVSVADDELLNWDAPFSEQPKIVQDALRVAFTKHNYRVDPQDTAGEMYDTLVNDQAYMRPAATKTQLKEYVSKLLESYGVKGIKFFDSMSRADVVYVNGQKLTKSDLNNLSYSLVPYKATLRKIIREGVDAVRADLERKVAETTAMFERISAESAAKYNVTRDPAETRARLQADVAKTYESEQLEWLKNNQVSTADRTRNLVIFNDKDIFRVGSAVDANRQRMRFGIAGEVSLQITQNKKLQSKLKTAKDMQKAGESVADIWKATGWVLGSDSKWRYEIPDTGAKLSAPIPIGTEVDIAYVLQHDLLFDTYPMLTASSGMKQGITISANDSMDSGSAVFMPLSNQLIVSSHTPVKEQLAVILHELQHAIQEIEGFAPGGSAENVVFSVSTLEKLAAGLKERIAAGDPSLPKLTDEQFNRFFSALETLTELYRVFETRIAELHAAFDKRTKNSKLTKRQITEFQDDLYQAIAEEEQILYAEQDRLSDALGSAGISYDNFSIALYEQIAGELEARLVEQRLSLTETERKNTPPVSPVSVANMLTPTLSHGGIVYERSKGISKLPKALQAPTGSLLTNLFTNVKNAVLATALTDDVVAMASKFMKSAKDYLKAQYARQAIRLGVERRLDNILSQYEKLPKELQGEGKGSVNEFIYDMTMRKQWGFYPGAHRVGRTLFTINKDLQLRFVAFPAEAQQLIRDTFEHGYEMLMLKQKALSDSLDRAYKDRLDAAKGDPDATKKLTDAKAADAKKQAKLFSLDISVPYAYLGRYGDYVVVAKSKEFIAAEEVAKGGRSRVVAAASGRPGYVLGDPQSAREWLAANYANPEHYIVQFVESQGEADQVAAKLIATGKYDVQPEDAGVKEAQASYNGSDLFLAVTRLKNLADRTDATADAHINKLLSDLVLMTAAESSARKSELVRRSVTGADKNMMRNLATSGRADAHMLSVLMHGEEITDALEGMREEARSNRREAMPIYNELFIRHAASLDYKTPKALPTALVRLSSLFYLATNPAYYMQQILQTSVLSVPYMAGRLGYFRAVRQTQQAYKDIAALTKGLSITDSLDFSKAPADVRAMLETLVGMGKIDVGMDAEGKAFAGEEGVFPSVMRKLQSVNARIESINRAVAAVAAYRGYTQRYGSGNPQAAIEYAAEVVSNSHGSYDGFTTPRVLTGNVSRVLLQFKRFQIVQLSMLAKTINTAFKGASADERKVARKTLQFIAAHMMVLGGALGVPFVYQLSWIIAKLFGDEPDDPEAMLRRIIGNQQASDLLLKGAPYALFGVDLGSKLAMQNAASILPFVDADLSRSGLEKIYVGLLGPSAALSLKFADGLGLMAKGDYYKGLEMVMPNGIANAMKAGRFATEGVTMRNGDLVLRPEEISMVDAAFQAVGLPTDTITRRMFTQKLAKDMDGFYQEKTSEIKRDYVEAFRKGDSAAMGDARREWEEMQASRVRNGYTRQPASTLFKAPMEVTKRERDVVGGVETTRQNKAFVERVSQL